MVLFKRFFYALKEKIYIMLSVLKGIDFKNNAFKSHPTLDDIAYAYCVARLTASFSPDYRLKVGSVIFDNHRLYNSSFNSKSSFAKNYDDCVDRENEKSHEELIHSEVRTLISCPINLKTRDAYILITNAPCVKCASAILDSGIKKVWYCGEHDDNEGVKLLEESGRVEVYNYGDELDLLNEYYVTEFLPVITSKVNRFKTF